jgi:hypothetical protein
MFEIDWKGLILPFAYIGVLLGSLITFSSLYRKRKAGENLHVLKINVQLLTLYSCIRNPWTLVSSAHATKYLPLFTTP